LTAGTITRVSVTSQGGQANGDSYNPSISDDGSLVSFTSDATNLVGADHNHASDVFVHNMTTGATRRVSVSSIGRRQNSAVPSPPGAPAGSPLPPLRPRTRPGRAITACGPTPPPSRQEPAPPRPPTSPATAARAATRGWSPRARCCGPATTTASRPPPRATAR